MKPDEASRAKTFDEFVDVMIAIYHDHLQHTMGALNSKGEGRFASNEHVMNPEMAGTARRRREWFESLDENGKAQLEAILSDTLRLAMTAACQVLDGWAGGADGNCTGSVDIPHELAEYAVYKKVYSTYEDYQQDEAVASVRVTGIDGGDQFMYAFYHGVTQEPENS